MFVPEPAAELSEYVDDLRRNGFRVCRGSAGTYWVLFNERVAQRVPACAVTSPSQAEVDAVLRATGAVVASYLIEPDDYYPANSCLYLCSDGNYSLEALPAAMQRNVRRGMRELSIAPLEASELLAHGGQAFCDTRARNGLDGGTESGFRRYFESRMRQPGQTYLAAWKGKEMAAFAMILRVDDWMEICCFSATSMLWSRPNDALMYVALSTYLSNHGCRVVSCGVSSIQAKTNAAGLHRFKRKVGFNATPVHRAFVLHPSVRRFARPVALKTAHTLVNSLLRIRPGNLALKRAGGVLASLRGSTSMMPVREPDTHKENTQPTGGRIPVSVRELKPHSVTQLG